MKQHYEYNSYFHKSKKQFKYLQKCDILKAKICATRGITLIHVKYDKKVTEQYLLLKIAETNPKLYNRLKQEKILVKLDKV